MELNIFPILILTAKLLQQKNIYATTLKKISLSSQAIKSLIFQGLLNVIECAKIYY